MRKVTPIIICLVTLLLSGCSYLTKASGLQSRDNEYQTAHSVPPLRIPPGLSSDSFQTSYPVPDHTYPEASKTVSLIPPGLTEKS